MVADFARNSKLRVLSVFGYPACAAKLVTMVIPPNPLQREDGPANMQLEFLQQGAHIPPLCRDTCMTNFGTGRKSQDTYTPYVYRSPDSLAPCLIGKLITLAVFIICHSKIS